MFIQDKAFLISRISFSESSTILNCFTENHGYKSFLLKAAKKKYAAYIQSMSPLLINYKSKSNEKLEIIYSIDFFTNPISFEDDIVKSGIIFFQNEILKNVLLNGQCDYELFTFLENEYLWLKESINFNNYMFYWLFECISILGFSAINYDEKLLDENENLLFHKYKILDKSQVIINKLNSSEKNQLLSAIMHYFRLKIPQFKDIKSINTFKELWE